MGDLEQEAKGEARQAALQRDGAGVDAALQQGLACRQDAVHQPLALLRDV